MKTDFSQYRKLRATGLKIVVAMLAACVCVVVAGGRHSGLGLVVAVLGLVVSAFSLAAFRCTKCTHCGKSVFPTWGSYRMTKRIENRQPVICAHCGEEIGTD